MAGTLYKYVDFGTGPILVRAAHLYDPSLYWYGASSGQRDGIGIIARGKGNGAKDLLIPSLDWERDICVYASGGDIFRNYQCPKVSFTANGVPSVKNGMAYFNHNNDEYSPAHASHFHLGMYCATTNRYTRKIQARDYDTYDSQLHRLEGVTGMVNSFNAFHGNQSDTPHGSVFVYDNSNAIEPTFLSLVALRNMFIGDVCARHTSSGDASLWRAWSWIAGPTTNGYTFYVGPNESPNRPVRMTVVRNLHKTVSIDGQDHTLYMVSLEFSRNSIGGEWMNVEGPWYELLPQSGVASSMYVLEEWVTCHKPGTL